MIDLITLAAEASTALASPSIATMSAIATHSANIELPGWFSAIRHPFAQGLIVALLTQILKLGFKVPREKKAWMIFFSAIAAIAAAVLSNLGGSGSGGLDLDALWEYAMDAAEALLLGIGVYKGTGHLVTAAKLLPIRSRQMT